MPNHKVCSRCGVDQTADNSGTRSAGKYWDTYCRPCRNIITKEYAKAKPEWAKAKQKRAYIKWRYGVDDEKYQEMIKSGCAICGSTELLCVDHDHACCSGQRTCGKCVRGVLCNKHNIMFGMVNDSTEELQKMVEYLAN